MTAAAVRRALSPHVSAQIERIDWVETIDSTSSALLRTAAQQPDRAMLIADLQTAGRGQRGRGWTSPAGANLYLSLFARMPVALSALGGLSLAVGVACADALHAGGIAGVRLKWPNDLQIDGRKLGGILIESAGMRGDAVELVIGIGLNVAMPADAAQSIDQPWTDLAAHGGDADRAQWAARLLDALLPALDRFAADGWPAFAAQWARYDALAGAAVRVVDATGERHGIARGIAGDGALLVRIGDQDVRFHSGDVSLRRA